VLEAWFWLFLCVCGLLLDLVSVSMNGREVVSLGEYSTW
jgi:hypothetical protein